VKVVASVVAFVLLAGACSDSDGGEFCDQVSALGDLDELGRSGVDGDAFRDVRDRLADLDPPPELAPDVDALVALYDLVIERFGELDLREPTAEQLAELQVVQQELEAGLLAADASLARMREATADCVE
jgi:hypothetical protein